MTNKFLNKEIAPNSVEVASIKPTKNLLVFLHGVGSDGSDLISLVPYIQNSMPDYHFFSPDGVEPYDMAPFGRQWFSLMDRSKNTVLDLAETNAPKVEDIIKEKQKELGLSNKDTIIFGFSQGSMIGNYLTLTQENEPYKAMISCSGRLIEPKKLLNTKTPICIIHGAEDDIVEPEESKNLAKYCQENNIKHDLLIIPNLNHSIEMKGISFALKFLTVACIDSVVKN